jgi:hypothetical protein
MRSRSFFAFVALAHFTSSATSAMTAPSDPNPQLIWALTTYAEDSTYGSTFVPAGTVIVGLQGIAPPECPSGYWTPGGTATTKQTYAVLLAAWTANKKVQIWYDPAQIRPNSGVPYCKINAVMAVP